jgi:pimeloyl-ACP methyl ester carboxylesterase
MIFLLLPATLILGLLLWLVGAIWLTAKAFRESAGRGAVYLLIPFSLLHFGATRWPKTKTPLILLAAGFGVLLLFIFAIAPFVFSHLLTHASSRSEDSEINTSALAAEVAYREVEFKSTDGVRLSGWYLPRETPLFHNDSEGESGAPVTIIYCHGLFRSRLEMLERAEKFSQQGYAGLLMDFRRHGKSGEAMTSMGYLERLDIIGAVHYLRDSLQTQTPIVVYGVSMGAAAALLAAAEEPAIAGLIIDSSFLSFDETITHHAKLFFNLPRFPVASALIMFTKWRVGFRPEDFDLQRAVQKIGDRPMLFIAGGEDKRMPPEIAQTLYEAAPSTHKNIVIIPNASHGKAFSTDPETCTKAILDYLQKVVEVKGATHGKDATP